MRELARLTGNTDMLRIHVDDQMDAKSVIGAYVTTAVPGEFAWAAGPLTQVRLGQHGGVGFHAVFQMPHWEALHALFVGTARCLCGDAACSMPLPVCMPACSRGAWVQAATEGRWLLLEGIDLAPPDLLASLVPLLESRQLPTQLHGQAATCHPGFQLVATVTTLPGTLLHQLASQAALLECALACSQGSSGCVCKSTCQTPASN